MNPVSTNRMRFSEYLESVGIAANTAKAYQSTLNKKITDAIRDLCNTDLGNIFGVVDARLLTYWMNILKDKKEFTLINQETHGAPYAALKKYIEFAKYLAKQPKK